MNRTNLPVDRGHCRRPACSPRPTDCSLHHNHRPLPASTAREPAEACCSELQDSCPELQATAKLAVALHCKLKFSCNTGKMDCIASQLSYIATKLSYIASQLSYIANQLPCTASQLPCIASQMLCIASQLYCTASRLPCIASRLPCTASQLPCIAKMLPWIASKLSCIFDQPVTLHYHSDQQAPDIASQTIFPALPVSLLLSIQLHCQSAQQSSQPYVLHCQPTRQANKAHITSL